MQWLSNMRSYNFDTCFRHLGAEVISQASNWISSASTQFCTVEITKIAFFRALNIFLNTQKRILFEKTEQINYGYSIKNWNIWWFNRKFLSNAPLWRNAETPSSCICIPIYPNFFTFVPLILKYCQSYYTSLCSNGVYRL